MQQYMLLQRNLVYTGITRGKKLVVLIGQRKALAMSIKNNRTENRFSGQLARLIAGKTVSQQASVFCKLTKQRQVISATE
jgi:ATP-dependent exoDNAse (exonuclease V) alpha subunit